MNRPEQSKEAGSAKTESNVLGRESKYSWDGRKAPQSQGGCFQPSRKLVVGAEARVKGQAVHDPLCPDFTHTYTYTHRVTGQSWVVVVHPFNPSIQEAEPGRSL